MFQIRICSDTELLSNKSIEDTDPVSPIFPSKYEVLSNTIAILRKTIKLSVYTSVPDPDPPGFKIIWSYGSGSRPGSGPSLFSQQFMKYILNMY